eukprot:4421223-Pyramimonas_sp.AAC.1
MTARARVYPPKFARALAGGVRASTNVAIPETSPGQIRVAREAGGPELYLAESYPADVEEGEALEGDPDPEGVAQDRPFEIAPKVRRLIHKVHVNLGHPHKDVFLKVLRGAQAKPEVLKFVHDEYRRGDCAAHSRPASSRFVAVPRTLEFNRIIASDTFYVTFKLEQMPFLNIICHGANYQVVEMYDGTALGAWRAFMRAWMRAFSFTPCSPSPTEGLSFGVISREVWNIWGYFSMSRTQRVRGRTAEPRDTGGGLRTSWFGPPRPLSSPPRWSSKRWSTK